MSNQNTYKPKNWNALCDVCGFKFKSHDLRLRWDNMMVCRADWEPRHPQDFLRAVKETSNHLPWTRPDHDGPDVGPDYVTLYVDSGYIDDLTHLPYLYVEEL